MDPRRIILLTHLVALSWGVEGQALIPCDSDPCLNNGTCFNFQTGFGFFCLCEPGLTGTQCESDIPECMSDPCLNNAACTELLNGYECDCAAGFDGTNCGNDIDECASMPCLGFATCLDMVNGYICDCEPGFGGTTCEININECASFPCQNSGICIDYVNGYTCSCPSGFTGGNCEIESSLCPREPITKQAEGVLTRVEWKTPIVHITDKDQIIELKQDTPMGPGDFFPVGTTEVMYTALDAVCRFQIIVEGDEIALDVTSPEVYNCPEDQLRYTLDNDQYSITPVWREPFATDDSCLPVVKQSSHSPGDMFAEGATKVTYNFTDHTGNRAQCIFIISVIGKNTTEGIPKFSFCPSSIRFFLPDSSNEANITWDEPKIEERFAISKTHSSGDTFKIGRTVVSYTTLSPEGNSALCQFNVDVIDITPPRIFLCPPSRRVKLCRGWTTVFWTEPFSEDNSGLPVRKNQSHHPGVRVFSKGTIIVNYTFSDVFNNTSVCSFNITVHQDSCQRGLYELHPILVYTILGLIILILIILITINIWINSGVADDKVDL